MKFQQIILLLTIFLYSTDSITSNIYHQECLTDLIKKDKNAGPIIKRDFIINESNPISVPIVIEVSNRIVHQLVSNVFAIYLKEILGYRNVTFKHFNDYMISCHVSEFSDFSNSCTYQTDYPYMPNNQHENLTNNSNSMETILPQTVINLDTWIQSDVHVLTTQSRSDIVDCGLLTEPARIGWYIPEELSIIPNYQFLSYTMFKDSDIVEMFDLDTSYLADVERDSFNEETGKYYCDDEMYPKYNLSCQRGYHIPPQCKTNPCALLLTSYPEMTGFVVKHIEELYLYVKVIWLGPNLYDVVSRLRTVLRNTTFRRSMVTLSWSPSDVIIPNKFDFKVVTFPPCETMNSTKDVGCKYDSIKIQKIAWQKLETGAKPALYTLNKIYFTRDNTSNLLSLYNSKRKSNKQTNNSIQNIQANNVYNVSCTWLRNNYNLITSTWEGLEKININLLGIFPSYLSGFQNLNGYHIYFAMNMAIEEINKRTDILPEYNLNLKLKNGDCKTAQVDQVMKSVFDHSDTDISGIIGPSCSDTLDYFTGRIKANNVVAISYSADSSSYTKTSTSPLFFRTIGDIKQFIYVYSDLFQKLNWKTIGILSEEGNKYSDYIPHIKKELKGHNIHYIESEKITKDREPTDIKKAVLDMKEQNVKVIIVNLLLSGVGSVMCNAYHLNMTAERGYVWFLPYWLTDDWYLSIENHTEAESCSTEQIIETIKGSFSIQHQYFAEPNFTTSMNFTVEEWGKKFINESVNDFNYEGYAGFAYDAVWTFAYAFEKLTKKNGIQTNSDLTVIKGDELVPVIQNISFNGVSGPISFPPGKTSRVGNITVKQWFPNKTINVGLYISDIKRLNLHTNLIQWLTPGGVTPDDGTLPSCLFSGIATRFNVSCDQAAFLFVIFVILIISMLVGTSILYTERRYDKKISELRQKSQNFIEERHDAWQMARDKVVINTKIGEGAFGTVYRGEAEIGDKGWINVAVKTLKPGASLDEELDFSSEAEMMKRFDHKNIVKLIGVCTKQEPLYTVMEFMLYGDLKTYLISRRDLVYSKTYNNQESEISNKKLTNMALDIARALSYLADNKYVHRDVASRNCLINAQNIVKLADFGLTRRTFDKDYYKFNINKSGMFPIRWMAPECISDGLFTPASDVWSFGILLYEIITFGGIPYVGLKNSEVEQYVLKGNMISIPKGIRPPLEKLILNCCSHNYEIRPTAKEIVEYIGNNRNLLSPCLDVPKSYPLYEEDDEELIRKLLNQINNVTNVCNDCWIGGNYIRSGSNSSQESQFEPLLNNQLKISSHC